MTPEGEIKAAVLKALAPLEAMGRCVVIRMQSGTRSGGRMRLAPSGTPDLLVLVDDGRCVWLEIKRPSKHQRARNDATRKAQDAWHAKAGRLGHATWIVQSAQDAVSVVLRDFDTRVAARILESTGAYLKSTGENT